jgi:RNA polymerase sigma-70 factor (ECF subfamily)
MEDVQDNELIDEVLRGNMQAFEKIVCRYQSMVFTLALRVAGQREEAEEIAQDVFIKLFKSLHTFHKKSKFSTWVYRITYNESVNFLRSSGKKIRPVELTEAAHFSLADHQNHLEITEEKQMILDSVMSLPEIERIIITLYYYEDVPVKEIAEITGLTETNVKARLFRSRQKLYDEILDRQHKLNRVAYEK